MQAVEINQAGEILHVTNVKNRYIKKTAKASQKTANVMNLTNKPGHRKNHKYLKRNEM